MTQTSITAPRARVAHTVSTTETFASPINGQTMTVVRTACGQEIIGGKAPSPRATACAACASRVE